MEVGDPQEATRRLAVSPHARERAAERIPGAAGHPNLVGLVYRDVQLAFRERRTAKSMPRWVAGEEHRSTTRKGPAVRYCWPESREYAYVLMRGSVPGESGHVWIVKTVLPAAA